MPNTTDFSRKLNLKDMNQTVENGIVTVNFSFHLIFQYILEIPEIPDLEEMPDPAEDIAFQVAEAPESV